MHLLQRKREHSPPSALLVGSKHDPVLSAVYGIEIYVFSEPSTYNPEVTLYSAYAWDKKTNRIGHCYYTASKDIAIQAAVGHLFVLSANTLKLKNSDRINIRNLKIDLSTGLLLVFFGIVLIYMGFALTLYLTTH